MSAKIKDLSKLSEHLGKDSHESKGGNMGDNSIPTIDICGKKTLEYVCDCLAHFNRGNNDLTLRAIGGSISKGVEISRILKKEFGVIIKDSKIETFQIELKEQDDHYSQLNTSCLQINLESDLSKKSATPSKYRFPDSYFIDFPIYHLLLDWQLGKHKEIHLYKIKRSGDIPLMSIADQPGSFSCRRTVTKDQDEKAFYSIGNALYRSGLLLPINWYKIAKKLSEFDDIILGIDTNILYNCTISEHLVPSILLIDPKEYVHTPNWILFVVPSAVMHELEESANIRTGGYLQLEGRMGFRALQEIIELSQSSDIPGISLIIVGAANPILDTRVELQGLREDFVRREKSLRKDNQIQEKVLRFTRSLKTSSGDMIIRDQYKDFLKQINFHKGTYFLTADKSNTALARTEGLHPIYFPFPSRYYETNSVFQSYKVKTADGKGITIKVPLGKLIYEMAVQFGNLKIKWADKEIEIHCDAKGETLDHWICRCLRIDKRDFNKLCPEDYDGIFDLNIVTEIWQRLTENFVGLEEI